MYVCMCMFWGGRVILLQSQLNQGPASPKSAKEVWSGPLSWTPLSLALLGSVDGRSATRLPSNGTSMWSGKGWAGEEVGSGGGRREEGVRVRRVNGILVGQGERQKERIWV